MLKLDQVSFRYGIQQPWVIRNFSLQLQPGEVIGLSGPSGRGKTTLARLLAGYLRPQQGTVTLDGIALPKAAPCPVQLIFQHPELAMNPRWRIRQILHEGEFPSDGLMRALSIENSWLERWPHELSGGELQRIAVARALASFTRYLIADEMTAMLDASTQAQLWHVVLEVAQQRKLTIVVISHEQALVKRICHQVVTLP